MANGLPKNGRCHSSLVVQIAGECLIDLRESHERQAEAIVPTEVKDGA